MHDEYSWLFGTKAQVILSGALGGVVRWLTLKESVPAGIVSVIVGAICAVYLGPIVEPMLAPFVKVVLVEEQGRASFAGFILGMTGITVSGFVIDVMRARKREAERKAGD